MRTYRMTALFAFTVAAAAPCSIARAQVTTTTTTTTSNGDVAILSQKNVVDHLIVGDSLEVQAAQLAAMRTQNAAVKDFATMLLTDHTAHLANLRKLAGKRDIGRELNPSDSTAAHGARMLAQLGTMPADAGFDRAFVAHQIQHHEQVLANLAQLRAASKDDDLQQDIDATRPLIEKHLAQARVVAAQLGMHADSTAAPMTMPMPMPMPAKTPTTAPTTAPATTPPATTPPTTKPTTPTTPTR